VLKWHNPNTHLPLASNLSKIFKLASQHGLAADRSPQNAFLQNHGKLQWIIFGKQGTSLHSHLHAIMNDVII